MFNEKATVFLLHLFDFRVSFIKTVQPAGLTASGFSLLPAAPWEPPLPLTFPPLCPAGSLPDIHRPHGERQGLHTAHQARLPLWLLDSSPPRPLCPAPPLDGPPARASLVCFPQLRMIQKLPSPTRLSEASRGHFGVLSNKSGNVTGA